MNDTTILFKGVFSLPQLQVSNFCQNQKHELEIDNKALSLLFLFDFKLYKIEKPGQIKPCGIPSSFFNKKNTYLQKTKSLTIYAIRLFAL